MNILYTLTAYPPSIGGAQLHHHALAQRIATRHTIRVLTHWDSNRTDWLLGTTLTAPAQDCQYELDGISVHRIGIPLHRKVRLVPYVFLYYIAMNLSVSAIAANLVSRILQDARGSDLIHNVRIGREPISYASFHAAKRRDIPFVFTPLHHPRWVGWRYRVYTDLYKSADLIIALTRSEQKHLMALGVEPHKIFITGIGPILSSEAYPDEFRRKNSIDGPIVLFLGQHYTYKGYRHLLEATKNVWRMEPETHFVFIGPAVGDSERIFSRIPDSRIHRLGTVNLQEKSNALAASTILCVPSTQESFGGVYTEAWSYGKPVIGCRVPAVSEIIYDGEDGLLVDQDSAEIADRIVELLGSDKLRSTMGKRGKKKVETQYSWEAIANRTEQAYQAVLR